MSDDDQTIATGNMCKNLVKFGHVFFAICQRTDRQNDGHADRNTSHPTRGKVIQSVSSN